MTSGLGAPDRAIRSAWLLIAGLGAGVAADVAFDPDRRHVPLCPMHSLTGLWCPLCGGLRATYSIAHGRLATALHDNALLITASPLIALWLLDQLWRAHRGRPRRTITRPAVFAIASVMVIFTVLRNIPSLAFLSP